MDADDDELAATYEQQMLEHAQRQTRALESLRNYVFIALSVSAVALLVWVIALIGSV